MEEFVCVEGYDKYLVSNYGRVLSLYGKKKKILKLSVDYYGYQTVGLRKNKKKKTTSIHRLVADHFVSGKKEGLFVHHVDENRQNNHFKNLQWVTQQYNTSISTGIYFKLISPDGEVFEGFNIAKFSQENNLPESCMWRLVRGIRNQHRGWKRYEE